MDAGSPWSRWRRTAVDVLLVVASIGYGLTVQPAVVSAPPLSQLRPVEAVVAAVAISSVWWLRRVSPEWFVVLAVASTFVCDLTGALPPLALATLAVHRSVRRTTVVGLTMTALVLWQVWLFGVPSPSRPAQVAAGTVVLFAAAAGWGVAVRNRRQVVRLLRQQVADARTLADTRAREARREERARIARDMHDTLAHRMSLLSIQGAAIVERATPLSPEVRELATAMRTSARHSLEDLRWMMAALEQDDARYPPPGPGDIRRLVDEARALGDVALDVRPGWEALDEVPAPVGHVMYRVVQEALTNSRKHGRGRSATVTVAVNPPCSVEITVVESGDTTSRAGGPPAVPVPGTGRGLLGLEERARAVGGRLEHGPTEQGGFSVRALLPWVPEARR